MRKATVLAIAPIILFAWISFAENPPLQNSQPITPTEKTAPAKEANKEKETLNKISKATLDSLGFYVNAKSFFTITGPKTNIKITSKIQGLHKNPALSYIIVNSEELNEKIEVYVQGEKVAMKSSKDNKWTKQMVVTPVEFMEFLKDSVDNIKIMPEEKIDKISYNVLEATLNQEGINNLLGLYNVGVFPNAKKTSTVKIWSTKEDSLAYKINLQLEIVAENTSFNPLDDGENDASGKKKKENPKTIVKFNSEMLLVYAKDIEINVPDEVKTIWESKNKEENKFNIK
jgi:hypothetical protein